MQLRDTLERHLRAVGPPRRQARPAGVRSDGCWRRPSGSPRRREEAPRGGRTPPTPRRCAAGNAEPVPESRGQTTRRQPVSGEEAADPCSLVASPARGSHASTWSTSASSRSPPRSSSPGPIGVVIARNPVHSALMLVMTLFGVAVLFVLQQATSWPPCRSSSTPAPSWSSSSSSSCSSGSTGRRTSPPNRCAGSGPLAIAPGRPRGSWPGCSCSARSPSWSTGAHQATWPDRTPASRNVNLLGKPLFTTYLFPFEATAALLVIAVVGAVVLARRPLGARDRTTTSSRSTRPTAPRSIRRPERGAGHAGRGGRGGGRVSVNPDWYLGLGVRPLRHRRPRACWCAATC